MKYHSVILLLMAVLIIAVVVIGLIIVGFININQQNDGNLPQTTQISQTARPTPRPTPVRTQSNEDPIVGSWMNGMVFNADGTVGRDGTTSWKVNENGNNSYFVIADSTTEWLYNPESDTIHKRGAMDTFSRGIPEPTRTPTTKPTITTIKTTQTQEPGGTPTEGPFNYENCLLLCKITYNIEKDIGVYNDCIQTCNIENLKVRP